MAASDKETPRRPSVWPLYLMPVVVIGGVAGAIWLGGSLGDFYVDKLLPLLVTIWIGMGFSFAWDTARYSMHAEKFPPVMVAATGVLSALVLFSMLGFETLWQEPWLFGVAVWPGLQMARPWLESLLSGRAAATPPPAQQFESRGPVVESETRQAE